MRVVVGLAVVACAMAAGGAWWLGRSRPVRVGYMGGLTGRVADLGRAGRDGVMLAVEERNSAGGIRGRPIELLIRDDRQDPQAAVAALDELADAGVAAVIGPMTSAMSMAVVPRASARQLTLISPTTSSNELTGIDDSFIRVYPASATHVGPLVSHVWNAGWRNAAIVYDTANSAHTLGWRDLFRRDFEARGGVVGAVIPFASGPEVRFMDIARQIAQGSPDGVLLLSNAMDTAMLCQQLRKLGARVPVACSEWSATEEMIQFGGRSLDGLFFLHTFDRYSDLPRYRRFHEAFRARFGYEPGFASVHAYDAAQLLFAALERETRPSRMHNAVLGVGRLQGVQGAVSIDRYGDASRELMLMTVRSGRFERER